MESVEEDFDALPASILPQSKNSFTLASISSSAEEHWLEIGCEDYKNGSNWLI